MADLPKIGSETKRKRALSDDELALAWHAVEEIGWPMGTAVQVLIQTGARRLEIAALRRDEIDWIRAARSGWRVTAPLRCTGEFAGKMMPNIASRFLASSSAYFANRSGQSPSCQCTIALRKSSTARRMSARAFDFISTISTTSIGSVETLDP